MKKHYLIALLLIVSTNSFWIYGNLKDTILIIDFGSPITHCIAICLERVQVPNQTCWYTDALQTFNEHRPKGIILAGGPASVLDKESPRLSQSLFESNVPILGICYGQQLMCIQFGGSVKHGIHPEYGKTNLHITDNCALTQSFWPAQSTAKVWMGHEDCIDQLPRGFKSIAHTEGSPHAIIADDNRKFYGVQFHPEYLALQEGHRLLQSFALNIVGIKPDPTLPRYPYRSQAIEPIDMHDCCGRKN